MNALSLLIVLYRRITLRGKTSYLTKILGSDFIAVLSTLEYGEYEMKNENIARVGRHIFIGPLKMTSLPVSVVQRRSLNHSQLS